MLNESSQADTPLLQMTALSYWLQHREALLAAPYQPHEQIRARQFALIRTLVDYAFTHVAFYRELYGAAGYTLGAIRNWRDFEALPVIDKKIITRAPPGTMLAEGPDGCARFCTRSSGSSGVPLTTWLDQNDVIRDFAEQTRFLHVATQGTLESNDWIYTLHHGGFWYSSVLGQYRVFRLMDLDCIDALANHWRILRPRVVTTLPSYLPLLATIGSLRRFGIAAVTTNSEMSTRAERMRYSKLFDVPVLDEYSSEEIGFIASECPEGSYHVVEDGVCVEILNADADGVGRIVVTDLGNVLMPLIRYDHGDLARRSDLPCGCGQTFCRLDALHGRRDDAFIAANGRYVPTASLLAICDELLTDERSSMSAYRLIQSSARRVEIHYKEMPSHQTDIGSVLAVLGQRLSSLLGHDVEIEAYRHETLPETSSYKRRTLLRTWDGQQ